MRKTLILFFVLSLTLFLSAQNREFRALWVATAWGGIDWPTTKIDSLAARDSLVDAQKSELIFLLDRACSANLNAIFLQVRGHADALYRSEIEPWSHALTGVRGGDPGYDPLDFAIAEAHARGLELHAWINPYRVSEFDERRDSIRAEWIINPGRHAFIDPARKECVDYTLRVISDIMHRYDIDGIVFDDYFYKNMPSNTYAKNEMHRTNVNNPLNLELGDWRREQVNRLIAAVADSINAIKPYLRFGISPFGIYSTSTRKAYNADFTQGDEVRPAEGIRGNDSYASMYCDAATWLKRGYIDYISPQLYWPSMPQTVTYKPGQDYATLAVWWNELSKRYGRPLFTSNDVADNNEVGKRGRRFNTPNDVENQLKINDSLDNVQGAVFYNASCFTNRNGANRYFAAGDSYHNRLPRGRYAARAIWPEIAWRTAQQAVGVANVYQLGDTLYWQSRGDARFAVYKIDADTAFLGTTYLEKFYVGNALEKYAVAPIDRFGKLYPAETMIQFFANESPVRVAQKGKIFAQDTPQGVLIRFADDDAHLVTVYAGGRVVYNRYVTGEGSLTIKCAPTHTLLVDGENI